jgi:hypothetical protein
MGASAMLVSIRLLVVPLISLVFELPHVEGREVSLAGSWEVCNLLSMYVAALHVLTYAFLRTL